MRTAEEIKAEIEATTNELENIRMELADAIRERDSFDRFDHITGC